MKPNLWKGTGILLLAAVLLISLMGSIQAAAPLKLESMTPGDGDSLGGTTGEISLTFNRPVEVFDNGGIPQIFFLTDKDGDGKGDELVEGGEAGTFTDVMKVSADNPNKVIIQINDKLQKDKYYVLILSPSVRIKGSSATTGDEVFEGIGVPRDMTGWSFNTIKNSDGNEEQNQELTQNQEQKEESEETPGEKTDINQEKQSNETYEQALLDKINSAKKGDRIPVEMDQYNTLTSPVLDALKEKEDVTLDFNKEVLITKITDTTLSRLDYTISLDSDSITDDYAKDYSWQLLLEFTSQYEAEILEKKDVTEEERYMLIHVPHEGPFPGVLTVTLQNVLDSQEEPSTLYLYYYDMEKSTLEEENPADSHGTNITFDITHGSDYLLTDTPIREQAYQGDVETGSSGINPIILAVSLLAAVAFIGAGTWYVLKNKKSKS